MKIVIKLVRQLSQKISQKISWSKILAIFLAGIVALSGTACTTSRAMSPSDSVNLDRSDQGMYPHKDTERDTSEADAKAERLIRNARQQQSRNFVDNVTPDKSVGEQVKDVGQSAKQAAEDIGESTKEAAQGTVEGTQRGVRNLKENAQDAVDQATDAID